MYISIYCCRKPPLISLYDRTPKVTQTAHIYASSCQVSFFSFLDRFQYHLQRQHEQIRGGAVAPGCPDVAHVCERGGEARWSRGAVAATAAGPYGTCPAPALAAAAYRHAVARATTSPHRHHRPIHPIVSAAVSSAARDICRRATASEGILLSRSRAPIACATGVELAIFNYAPIRRWSEPEPLCSGDTTATNPGVPVSGISDGYSGRDGPRIFDSFSPGAISSHSSPSTSYFINSTNDVSSRSGTTFDS